MAGGELPAPRRLLGLGIESAHVLEQLEDQFDAHLLGR